MSSSHKSPSQDLKTTLTALKHSIHTILQTILEFPEKDVISDSDIDYLQSMHGLVSNDKEFRDALLSQKIDINNNLKIPALLNLLNEFFIDPPPGKMLEAWNQYVTLKKVDTKKEKLSVIAADDLVEFTQIFLPNDEALLKSLSEKIKIIEDVLADSKILIGATGYSLTNLKVSIDAKLNKLVNTSPPLQEFVKELESIPDSTPLKIISTNQANNQFAQTRKDLIFSYEQVVSQYLKTYEKIVSTDDLFLMQKHIDKQIPKDDFIRYSNFKDEYKRALRPYVKKMWRDILNEFKAIADEKKEPILNNYKRMHVFSRKFYFFRSEKKHEFASLHTALSDIMKKSDDNTPDTVIKELIQLLVNKFDAQRKKWVQLPQTTTWLEKNHFKFENEADKEKYFPRFLASQPNKHHYTRIFAFMLCRLSNAGVFDIGQFKPDLRSLLEKEGTLDLAKCAKDYPDINAIMNNVVNATHRFQPLQDYIQSKTNNAKEVDRFGVLVNQASELEKVYKKSDLEEMHKSIKDISKIIGLDENIKPQNDKLESQIQSLLNKLDKRPKA